LKKQTALPLRNARSLAGAADIQDRSEIRLPFQGRRGPMRIVLASVAHAG
jgi:hypothetical protein